MEGGEDARESVAVAAVLAAADRMARRAADGIRSGKPAGKRGGWRMPCEVSATSQDEARQAAVLAIMQGLGRLYGEAWRDRAPWGEDSRRGEAFRRWIALTGWRAAYNELTALPGGVTGRRSAGVRSLFVDLDGEARDEACQIAGAAFDPGDVEGSPWFSRSAAREVDKARDIRRARSLVFRRLLEPFKGKGKLTRHERQAKLAAIKRGRVVGLLLEGEGVGMAPQNVARILKELEIPRTGYGRGLAAALSRLH